MVNKKLNLLILCLLMLVAHYTTWAQVQSVPPMRQVIGSTGGSGVLPWGTIDYTVGEVMVTTDSTATPFSNFKWLTQGFQQPDNYGLSVEALGVNSTCIGGNNGSANLSVLNSIGPVSYSWNNLPFGTTHLFENLSPGIYYYTVKDSIYSISDSMIITETQVDCGPLLIPYTGITPNGDNKNDKWIIEGINNFETNSVFIYSRWGDLVWSAKNYDNVTVVWDGTYKNGNVLPDATYFYIIEAVEKSGKKTFKKAWVELTH